MMFCLKVCRLKWLELDVTVWLQKVTKRINIDFFVHTFCNHWVLFSIALSRLSSFFSCQEGLSFCALPSLDWPVSGDTSGAESLWRVLVTWKSLEGWQCSTSGRMKV